MLSRDEYLKAYDKSLKEVSGAERITKAILSDLSRSILGALHALEGFDHKLVGEIQLMNRLLPVLTPVNQKAATLFFKKFSGYSFDERSKTNPGGTNNFTNLIQKGKVKHKEMLIEWLSDPHNNIWTWADRELEIKPKEFKLSSVTKLIEKAREATEGNDEAILLAVLDGGISIESLVLVMEHMAQRVEEAKKEQPQFEEAPF